MSAPYDRQAEETDSTFEGFQAYRDMGLGRSLAKVASMLGKSTPLMERWSSANRWVKRAAAWDTYVDMRTRNAELRELEKMRARQIRIACDLQSFGDTELQKHRAQAKKLKKATLKPDELLRMVKEGAIMERVNRGEPGEIVQTTGRDIDLSQMTTKDLADLKRLREKLTKVD